MRGRRDRNYDGGETLDRGRGGSMDKLHAGEGGNGRASKVTEFQRCEKWAKKKSHRSDVGGEGMHPEVRWCKGKGEKANEEILVL